VGLSKRFKITFAFKGFIFLLADLDRVLIFFSTDLLFLLLGVFERVRFGKISTSLGVLGDTTPSFLDLLVNMAN